MELTQFCLSRNISLESNEPRTRVIEEERRVMPAFKGAEAEPFACGEGQMAKLGDCSGSEDGETMARYLLLKQGIML
jgi:hypothetical protein